MLQKNPKIKILDLVLIAISLVGIILFWYLEKNIIFQTAIIILLLFAGYRIGKGDNGPVLYIVGFIVSAVLFNLSESQKLIDTGVTALFIFSLVIFLFYYRHARTSHEHSFSQIFSIYNVLLGLLVAEIYSVLVFFLIDPKNKSIIIILFLWIFDEIVELFESKNLTKKAATILIIIFILLLTVVLLTSPFKDF